MGSNLWAVMDKNGVLFDLYRETGSENHCTPGRNHPPDRDFGVIFAPFYAFFNDFVPILT